MRRREFIAVLVGGSFATYRHASAQAAERKLPKIGLLLNVRSENYDALSAGLRAAGYVDGRNVLLETRFHGNSLEQLDLFVSEFAALKCSVIFASSPYGIRAAMKATTTIPIVGVDLETDPVASGWAQGLARPGGNLTGVFLDIPELGGKLTEFAREIVPRLSRLAILWDSAIGGTQFKATEAAARALGLTIFPLPVEGEDELTIAVQHAIEAQAECVVLLSSPLFIRSRSALVDLALRARLPLVSLFTSFPEAGALLAYGPNLASMFRQTASYIDRIVRDEKPGDLPIERPSRFELAINLKTAAALGLTMPQSLLARADEVIE